MTKQEAKQAIKEGKEVRHWLFTSGESIHMVDGVLYDEAGLILNAIEFWSLRTGINFDTGWSIVE